MLLRLHPGMTVSCQGDTVMPVMPLSCHCHARVMPGCPCLSRNTERGKGQYVIDTSAFHICSSARLWCHYYWSQGDGHEKSHCKTLQLCCLNSDRIEIHLYNKTHTQQSFCINPLPPSLLSLVDLVLVKTHHGYWSQTSGICPTELSPALAKLC